MSVLKAFVWAAYFITLFVAVYWLLLYFEKGKAPAQPVPRKTPKRWPGVTVIVPAYNEEGSLAGTIDSLLALDYPNLRVIVVDDGSQDRTREIGEEYAREHEEVTFFSQENQGKAVALNNALEKVRTKYFACLDADSFVEPDAAKNMVRAFEADDQLQIVTPVMRVTRPENWLQKFQRVEYLAAMLLVRMMASIEGNYVAPGPFSMYRTETVKDLGGFDEDNLVEDQEIAYRVQKNHGRIRQVADAKVDTIAPDTFKGLSRQRNRWIKGTLLNIIHYRSLLFNKDYGEFGNVVMPITLTTFFLAIIALSSFLYYLIKPLFEGVRDLFLIGFDIVPMIENMRFTFNILDPNYTSIIIIWALLGLSVFILYLASRLYQDDMTRYGRLYIIPYFFIYFLILSFISVQVLIEVAIGKKQQW